MNGSHFEPVRAGVVTLALVLLALAPTNAPAGSTPLPPPPVPPENPIKESVRVLGKILFWDEQMSSNGTVSCGTCHQPAAGGSDARIGVHPSADGTTPTADDVYGSPGMRRFSSTGVPQEDPLFGFGLQVTHRSANTAIGAAYAPDLFWGGRASSTFVDPETGLVSIPTGGALESQAVQPILGRVEMAYEGRTWDDVRWKLARSVPLQDATDLPPDVAAALTGDPSYADLFQAAFDSPDVTAQRIAFAVATYQRTLYANQTPWDAFVAGDAQAMTQDQIDGWNFFQGAACSTCHTPPTFTDHSFHNIGIRPFPEDPGRQAVTGLFQDRGRFKVPTLRNVGLKPTHEHTGRLATVTDAVLWYRPFNPDRVEDNLDPLLPVFVDPAVVPKLVDFLENGLTDPRVAAETFPFDRPTLHAGALPALSIDPGGTTWSWPALDGVTRYNVYRGNIAALAVVGPDGLPGAGYGVCVSEGDPNPTDGAFVDPDVPPAGEGFFYVKSVVDSTGAERGLGSTSDGRARFVLVPCAAP